MWRQDQEKRALLQLRQLVNLTCRMERRTEYLSCTQLFQDDQHL